MWRSRRMADTMSTDTLDDLAALGDDFTRNPYPVYAALRARGPVHRVRTPEGANAWLVVGHQAGRAALADPRLSKEWDNASPSRAVQRRLGPRHAQLRPTAPHPAAQLVAKEFAPRRVEAVQPRVRQITDELLDAMLARPDGRADLVDAPCFPLPISVWSWRRSIGATWFGSWAGTASTARRLVAATATGAPWASVSSTGPSSRIRMVASRSSRFPSGSPSARGPVGTARGRVREGHAKGCSCQP
jgi:cytochrome P450